MIKNSYYFIVFFYLYSATRESCRTMLWNKEKELKKIKNQTEKVKNVCWKGELVRRKKQSANLLIKRSKFKKDVCATPK